MPAPAPRKAKVRLTNLTINEGSFVGAGDNPEAHITLFKNKGDDVPENNDDDGTAPEGLFSKIAARLRKWAGSPKTTSQIVAERAFADEFYKLRSAFMESVWSILDLSDPDEMAGMMGKTVNEFAAAAKRMIAAVGKVDAVKAADLQAIVDQMTTAVAVDAEKSDTPSAQSIDRAALADIVVKLEAFEFPAGVAAPTDTPTQEPPVKKSAAEILAAMPADERAAVEAHVKAAAATPTPAEKSTPADVVPASVQKAIDELTKTSADLAKRLEASEAETKKLKDEAETAQYVEKARKFPGLDVNKVAKQLKGAYAVSKEQGEELESLFAAQAAQAKKGQKRLTNSVGSSAPGEVDTNKAAAAETAMAKRIGEIRAAEPKLSKEQAYAKALEENPDLYNNMDVGELDDALDDGVDG